MSLTMKKLGFIALAAMYFSLNACKNDDPSVIKIFVRKAGENSLQANAQVVIIADVNSDPETPPYVDTILTNSSGFAYFEMDEFFDDMGKDQTTGYFDIVAKKDLDEGSGYMRARAHIVNVETVYITH